MTCPRTLYVVSSLVRIFPDKPEPEYGALKESISRLGLLDPILMWRGTVVDGYHRLRACLELGVEPRFDVLSDDADPMEIVVDRMGTQRRLNETARAAAAVRAMGKPKPGRPKGSGKNRANLRGFRTRRWAAEKFRVSERTITTMLKIMDPNSGAIPEVPSRPLYGPHFGQRRAECLGGKPGGAAGGYEPDFQRQDREVRAGRFDDQERCGPG